MSIESSIFDSLKSLVGNRVFPDVAPQRTVRPYITYQQSGGVSGNYLQATLLGKRNARFQINVWGDGRSDVSELSRTVEDVMVTSLKSYVLGAPVAIHEPETGLYGTLQFFSVWF